MSALAKKQPPLTTSYPTGTTAGDGSDIPEIEETAEVVLEAKLVRCCFSALHNASWSHVFIASSCRRSGTTKSSRRSSTGSLTSLRACSQRRT